MRPGAPMRILHVINNGTICGGAERLTADLAEQQRHDGHDVHVLSSDLPGSGRRFADSTWPVQGARGLAKVHRHYWNSAARTTLSARIAGWRPDVVHLHTVGLLSPASLPALRHVPTVMTVHGPELFVRGTVRGCLPASYFHASSRLNRLTPHGALAAAWASAVTGPVWRRSLRRHVDAFIAPSRFLAELTERSLGPAHVVGNGVHNAYLAAGRRSPSPSLGSSPRLVMAARLEDFKGPQVLLAAMPAILSRHPLVRLTIIGTGPFADKLNDMAAELEISHAVTITGWQTASTLAAVFARSDVALVPSLWPEAFGLAALEALAAGCPVVASGAGGLVDLVQHERTGLLVPPGDPAALADAVNRLLADRPLRTRLGDAGRLLGRQFTMRAHAEAVEAVYREARERHGRREAPRALASIGRGDTR